MTRFDEHLACTGRTLLCFAVTPVAILYVDRVCISRSQHLLPITKCDIIEVRENIVEIKEIDAFDGSPVLDLKADFFRFHIHPGTSRIPLLLRHIRPQAALSPGTGFFSRR